METGILKVKTAVRDGKLFRRIKPSPILSVWESQQEAKQIGYFRLFSTKIARSGSSLDFTRVFKGCGCAVVGQSWAFQAAQRELAAVEFCEDSAQKRQQATAGGV
ncbi:hypothetical protein C7B67_24870 [filamentous cyanobacterium Phorm 6]|nr:hypothetical protein C7B67_24870 [filamentous cyanobacterium Phorm 6]